MGKRCPIFSKLRIFFFLKKEKSWRAFHQAWKVVFPAGVSALVLDFPEKWENLTFIPVSALYDRLDYVWIKDNNKVPLNC